MDPVTTAIVAARVASADDREILNRASRDAIATAYGDLKSLLVERFTGSGDLITAVRQLEAMDTRMNRQKLHQEVKIARADQDFRLVQAADALLETIRAQPQGNSLVMTARTWDDL
jgi:hypothetical protein